MFTKRSYCEATVLHWSKWCLVTSVNYSYLHINAPNMAITIKLFQVSFKAIIKVVLYFVQKNLQSALKYRL